MTVPQRLSAVTLGVADVARATQFYESLGWRRSSGSQDMITFFSLPPQPVLAERRARADAATRLSEGAFQRLNRSVSSSGSCHIEMWVASPV
jgi:catechol 2,3-dioxygenase-like lactoylglutathione lyase family enzyme